MPDETSAIRKFRELTEEATRWKGQPVRVAHEAGRRFPHGPPSRYAASDEESWLGLPRWEGDPFGPIFAWIDEESDDDRP